MNELIYTEQDRYLRVDAFGQRTSARRGQPDLALWTQIGTVCRARDTRRLMFVCHRDGALPPVTMLSLIEQLPRHLDRRTAIAWVETHPEHLPDVQFAETAATNRGWAFRAFNAAHEAGAWLCSHRL